jgi:hypothetical protein
MCAVSEVFGTGKDLDGCTFHISPGHSGQVRSPFLQTGGKKTLAM